MKSCWPESESEAQLQTTTVNWK